MATLKQHQAAMVELLAHGTAIPASATRLAHALHDVLTYINGAENAPEAHTERRSDATTSGLNDAALAYDVAAVQPKRTSAEQQISVLNNTIRQLRESNLKLRQERDMLARELSYHEHPLSMPEQAGCRKEDTQADDGWVGWVGGERPVAAGEKVELNFRGFTARTTHHPECLVWEHRGRAGDIVAYRILGESK